jgi:hypothetical protein
MPSREYPGYFPRIDKDYPPHLIVDFVFELPVFDNVVIFGFFFAQLSSSNGTVKDHMAKMQSIE